MGGYSAGIVNQAGKNYYDPGDGSLVGCWLFDTGAGTVVKDRSQYDNHGTINGADWVADGLDYITSNSDYVAFGTADIWDIKSNITVLSWVRLDSAVKFDLAMKSPQNSTYIDFILVVNSSQYAGFRAYDGGWKGVYDDTTQLTVGNWYLVGGSYDGTIWKVYVNGVQVKSLTETFTLTTGGILESGRYYYSTSGPTTHADGVLHSLSIYNKVLTDQVIKAIYDAGMYHNQEYLSYDI